MKALDGWDTAEKKNQERAQKEAKTNPERELATTGPKEVKAEVVYRPKTGILYLDLGDDFDNAHNLPHATRLDILIEYFDLWPPVEGKKLRPDQECRPPPKRFCLCP